MDSINMSNRIWNQVKAASKAFKKGFYGQLQIWPVRTASNLACFLLSFVLALLYFTVLAFSYFSKHGQRVGLHIQLIWHPKKNLEADLELNLVKDWSKLTLSKS